MSEIEDNLTLRIMAFFDANPGEELTNKDVETKFSTTSAQAYWTSRCLCEMGVTVYRKEGVTKIYRRAA